MYALMRDAEMAGVDIFFNTHTIASIVENNKIHGVVAATKYKPMP